MQGKAYEYSAAIIASSVLYHSKVRAIASIVPGVLDSQKVTSSSELFHRFSFYTGHREKLPRTLMAIAIALPFIVILLRNPARHSNLLEVASS
jgi:hypothetical protein